MINTKVLNIIGIITIFLGLSMLPSSIWSLLESVQYNYDDIEFKNFLAIVLSSCITIGSGFFYIF